MVRDGEDLFGDEGADFFPDVRSWITSKLGKPEASMRFVGEAGLAFSCVSFDGTASDDSLGEAEMRPVISNLPLGLSLVSFSFFGELLGVRLSRAAISDRVGILDGDRGGWGNDDER